MIQPAFEILNQRGTPMFFSDVYSNLPTAGVVGRIFIRTDSPYGIYRDNGSSWDQIAGSGGGGISGSGAAGQVTFWDGTSSVSGSNNLWWDNSTNKFLVGTNNATGVGSAQITSSTGDSHLRVWGASSPSIRIDNAVSAATQRFAIGLATATNNFIQGSAAGDICITTASANAMLFGMWQTTNASEVMRISTANNLIIGSSVDAGFKLQINGDIRINGIRAGLGAGSISTNTGFGSSVLNANTTGNNNTAFGYLSLQSVTTGVWNTAIGSEAGKSITTGNSNVIIGVWAKRTATTGDDCVYIGQQVAKSGTGNNNTALGSQSGFSLTSGASNIFIGYKSGELITTGSNNTIIGTSNSITTGSNNTIIGLPSGLSSTLGNNIILADGSGNMRLAINNSGDVYIGGSTTYPTFAGYKLDTNGSFRSVSIRSENSSQTISGATAYQPNYFFGGATYSSGSTVTAIVSNWSQMNQTFNTCTLSNASAWTSYNVLTMSQSAGTITVTQPTYLNAVSSYNAQNYITGSVSMTLTHLAGIVIKPVLANASGTLTVTNYYSALINDTTQSAAAFSPTNRWGIYQEGSSDKNYFAANVNIGSTSNPGQKLYVNGSVRIDGQTSATAGGSAGLHLIVNLDGTNYKIALLNV